MTSDWARLRRFDFERGASAWWAPRRRAVVTALLIAAGATSACITDGGTQEGAIGVAALFVAVLVGGVVRGWRRERRGESPAREVAGDDSYLSSSGDSSTFWSSSGSDSSGDSQCGDTSDAGSASCGDSGGGGSGGSSD